MTRPRVYRPLPVPSAKDDTFDTILAITALPFAFGVGCFGMAVLLAMAGGVLQW